MTFQEVLEQARPNMGKYCKACPVCNGKHRVEIKEINQRSR